MEMESIVKYCFAYKMNQNNRSCSSEKRIILVSLFYKGSYVMARVACLVPENVSRFFPKLL